MTTHAIRRPGIEDSFEGNYIVSTYAIRRRRLQSEIQEIVKRYILDHNFRPGDPLPGEGELAAQMGISRPSLREAMKVLQTIGAIESRHGSGTYVGELTLDPLADGLAFQVLLASQHSDGVPQELHDLVDMRAMLETRLIARVAGKHTPAQIEAMRKLNNEMSSSVDQHVGFGETDLNLHQLFYEPLQSRVFSEFVRVNWRISNLAIRPYARASREAIVQEHRAIIDGLAGHDATEAVRAMTTHMHKLALTVATTYNADHLREDALFGT